jgi:hypothetical protein
MNIDTINALKQELLPIFLKYNISIEVHTDWGDYEGIYWYCKDSMDTILINTTSGDIDVEYLNEIEE